MPLSRPEQLAPWLGAAINDGVEALTIVQGLSREDTYARASLHPASDGGAAGTTSKIVIAGVPDFGRALLNIIQTCSPQPWRNCSNNARGNVVL
jgi:hypothetical protein